MDDSGDNFSVRDNSSEDYSARENMWDQAWPTSEGSAGAHPLEEPDNLDEDSPFPAVAGTSEGMEAVRDGEPYIPPMDPPVLPGGREGIHIATGFGTDAETEASQDQPLRGDIDIEEEVFLLLRQDSLTSKYPLDVEVDQGVVRITGQVPSFEDAEHAQSIISELDGVVDVVDDTTVVPTMAQ